VASTWDDIVVGSGPAGACVSRILAEEGRRVLMIERGRVVSEPPGSHMRNQPENRDDPDGWFAAVDRYLDLIDPEAPEAGLPAAATTSIVGGSGILWTNNCPQAVDGVDRPDVLDDDEWTTAYDAAEQLLGVRRDEFADSQRATAIRAALAAQLDGQGRRLTPLPLAGRRLSHDHIDYIGPADVLATSEAVVARQTGTVERIEINGGHVVGVHVDDNLLRADHVVLATGAVDAPLLLWRSGLEHPAIGRRLCFHPVLTTQVVLREGSTPIGDDDPLPRLGISPTTEHPWFTMVLRDTNPLPVDPSDLDVAAHRLVEIQAFGPIDPLPDNHLWVDDDGRARFEVPIRAADRDRLTAIEQDVAALIDSLGRVRRGSEPQWSVPDTAHLMGSCRIGEPDDGQSMVDVNGRVHGVEGLDVVGNSVVPNRLAVNPTLTAVALALHGQRSRLS
jgi:glycine/D-amino acid oxidase-like deaminating enzyme